MIKSHDNTKTATCAQPGVIMRGEWDAIVQQKGEASPVINQYFADTSLREGLTPEQLEEEQSATALQPEQISSMARAIPSDAQPPGLGTTSECEHSDLG